MNTDQLIAAMQPPSGEDRRVRDVMPGQKRGIFNAQDLADSMSQSVSGKRFRGDAILGPLRSVLPDQLARGLNVVNTGFSTTDAQTDEIITQLVYARPYHQHWEQGFVNNTTLFANRTEHIFDTPNVHTVADVPILNFLCELSDTIQKQRNYAPRGNALEVLSEMSQIYEALLPTSSADFWAKWNLLGPMTSFKVRPRAHCVGGAAAPPNPLASSSLL